ncbi:MAG: DUF4854 domain-containing protein [Ruminococcus sp.]|nr:DUF4854 domain-containing protein [Ruminococcus sp.]
MKKLFKKVISIAVLSLVVIGAASCGGNANTTEPAAEETTTEATTADAAQDDDSDSSAALGLTKFKTVDEYAKSDILKEQMESIKDSFAGTFEFDIYGEGNTFVYEYKYVDQIADSLVETTKETLDSSLESQKSVFVNIANTLPTVVEMDKADAKVAVRYLNADGTLITEAEFNAE